MKNGLLIHCHNEEVDDDDKKNQMTPSVCLAEVTL